MTEPIYTPEKIFWLKNPPVAQIYYALGCLSGEILEIIDKTVQIAQDNAETPYLSLDKKVRSQIETSISDIQRCFNMMKQGIKLLTEEQKKEVQPCILDTIGPKKEFFAKQVHECFTSDRMIVNTDYTLDVRIEEMDQAYKRMTHHLDSDSRR